MPEVAPPVTGNEDELQLLSKIYAQGYLTANIAAFKNTLDWMALDDDLLACFEEQGSP